MSSPRTFSSTFTNVSPSGNGVMVQLPSSMLMDLQMARARGSFAVPENTFTKSKQIGCCRQMENPPDVADESFRNRNNRPAPRKPNLRSGMKIGMRLKYHAH